jgi:dienelactone hydrolase
MADETFLSGGTLYKITIYPAPADGKKHVMILVLHGNAGLNPPFASQIHKFATSLAELGYVTAVPQYYRDDLLHLDDGDPRPHVATLSDAIAKVATRTDADPDRIGLIGYSLGAATAMTYVASNAAGKVKVLVDFFGPIENNTIIASGVAKFPPTIIFHNKNDKVVTYLPNSNTLNGMLPSSVEHRLVSYDDGSPQYRFHPFVEDGPADMDSRKQATEWVLKYLPLVR